MAAVVEEEVPAAPGPPGRAPPRPARALQRTLFVVFAATGFSALGLQVVWQRVISLNGGADLFSVTTVVAAFLAGLGLGNLAGGYLADRLGPRRSLVAFGLANAAIGTFAWFSLDLFYDLYNRVVGSVEGGGAAFAFHFALLVVPTTLMGLSLPLVARGVVRTTDETAALVGRLYAVNTLGAAAGASVFGWWALGTLGFTGAVRLSAAINLAAAASVLLLWRASSSPAAATPADAAVPADEAVPADAAVPAAGTAELAVETGDRVWPWIALYGLTGAVALGLELVFFRVIDAVMRSNSYTFGHVLSLYLLLFAAGAALGARLVRRAARPERWFLWLQYGAGVGSLAGLALLVAPLRLPGALGVRGFLERYFATDGFSVGGWAFSTGYERAALVFANVVTPLLVMGVTVLLLGASFPFVQAMVARRVSTLGRRTGTLLFANIVGNVVGIVLTGFVLIDWLGTVGTLRALAAVLLLPGLAAATLASGRRRQVALAGGAAALMAAALVAVPANHRLWSLLHSAAPGDLALAEDRACVNAHVRRGTDTFLYINGASQNGYPYDDYHVLIGLTPSLLHPAPAKAMAVGLGIGATSYGIAQDRRMGTVDTVEICGGEIDLIERLAAAGSPESRRLLDDPRVKLGVGDGRKYLLQSDERYDVITVDTLRPQSAYSGSLYSTEFYELVRDRLTDDGLFSQWTPTVRALETMRQVFPHVQTFQVPSYNNSSFAVASQQPFAYDPAQMVERMAAHVAPSSFSPGQADALRAFFAGARPKAERAGQPLAPVAADRVNRDLFPRDEYFVNNGP